METKAATSPPELEELARFYQSLGGLKEGRLKRPVRVHWLGDSHTQADFMTEPVRRRLGEFAPDGGPGYVRLGLDGFRHSRARSDSGGKWRKQPIQPSGRARVLDGVFGIGGIRAIPTDRAWASLRVKQSSELGPLRAAIEVRLGEGDALWLEQGGSKRKIEPSQEASGKERSNQRIEIPLLGGEELRLLHAAGSPEVFGAYVEAEANGVILDTVGINGARLATVLAWDETSHLEFLKAHQPDLLVLAFGTNEAFDSTDPLRYEAHLAELVGRFRKLDPELPCWVLGPMDAEAKQGGSLPRVAQVEAAFAAGAKANRCAFTSLKALMGGEGSFSAWAKAKPPLARSDRIHLTLLGYEEIGARVGKVLLPDGWSLPSLPASQEAGAGTSTPFPSPSPGEP